MSLGVLPGGRYRVVDESHLVDELAMLGWPDLIRAGDGASARRRASVAIEECVTRGLGFRADGERRWFDNVEVHNFINSSAAAGVELAKVSQDVERRMVEEAEHAPPSRVTMIVRRSLHVDAPAGTRVRLRLPYPFEDATQRDLHLDALSPNVRDHCVVEPGRLRLDLPMPDGPELTVEARYSVTLTGEEDRDVGDASLYLRPNDGLIVVTPRIEALARSLTDGGELAAMEAFWRFYFEHMHTGLIHFDELDSRDPLPSLVELGWSDCHAGSALIGAMCRAVGIPARIVSGYLVYPMRPTPHYWLEVLLDGKWMSFDAPFSWNLAGGDASDTRWSRRFFGRVDRRVKIQCLPRTFTGPPGVKVPADWYMVQDIDGAAAALTLLERETGRWLHRDSTQVLFGDSQEAHGL